MQHLDLKSGGSPSEQDASVIEKNKSEKNQKIAMMVVTGVVLGAFATLTVYMAKYTYSNPDPDNCWVVRDLDFSQLTKEKIIASAKDAHVDITEGYPVNMAKVFRTWFAWGFWANAIAVVAAIVTWGMTLGNVNAAKVIAGVSAVTYLLNWFVWLAIGTIWRFSKAGTAAAGDKLDRDYNVSDEYWQKQLQKTSELEGFQIKGGWFMKWLLLGSVVVVFAIVIGMAITFMTMCFCSPVNSFDFESKMEERVPTADFVESGEDNEASDIVKHQNKAPKSALI